MKKNKWIAVLLVVLLFTSVISGCSKKADGDTNQDTPVDAQTDSGADEAEENEADAGVGNETEGTSGEVELIVAAAASLTDVTAEIAEQYKKIAPEVTLTFTYGSSGALQTQIEQGAPVDLFMSAAVKQMDALTEGGFVQEDTRADLLENKVVLITPDGNEKGIESFEDLATDKVQMVALGDPESVPVGQYSETILGNLGILDPVREKANYGTDVRQVLTWVESGEVDCGIVYATDAAISDQVFIVGEAPEGSADPVIYPAAVMKACENQEAAKAFLEYLKGDEARAMFESYGFTRYQ